MQLNYYYETLQHLYKQMFYSKTLAQNCLRTKRGTEYLGNVSTSTTPNQCVPWKRHQSNNLTGSDEETFNYCRNPTSSTSIKPFCYVEIENQVVPELCSIPFCGKHFQPSLSVQRFWLLPVQNICFISTGSDYENTSCFIMLCWAVCMCW